MSSNELHLRMEMQEEKLKTQKLEEQNKLLSAKLRVLMKLIDINAPSLRERAKKVEQSEEISSLLDLLMVGKSGTKEIVAPKMARTTSVDLPRVAGTPAVALNPHTIGSRPINPIPLNYSNQSFQSLALTPIPVPPNFPTGPLRFDTGQGLSLGNAQMNWTIYTGKEHAATATRPVQNNAVTQKITPVQPRTAQQIRSIGNKQSSSAQTVKQIVQSTNAKPPTVPQTSASLNGNNQVIESQKDSKLISSGTPASLPPPLIKPATPSSEVAKPVVTPLVKATSVAPATAPQPQEKARSPVTAPSTVPRVSSAEFKLNRFELPSFKKVPQSINTKIEIEESKDQRQPESPHLISDDEEEDDSKPHPPKEATRLPPPLKKYENTKFALNSKQRKVNRVLSANGSNPFSSKPIRKGSLLVPSTASSGLQSQLPSADSTTSKTAKPEINVVSDDDDLEFVNKIKNDVMKQIVGGKESAEGKEENQKEHDVVAEKMNTIKNSFKANLFPSFSSPGKSPRKTQRKERTPSPLLFADSEETDEEKEKGKSNGLASLMDSDEDVKIVKKPTDSGKRKGSIARKMSSTFKKKKDMELTLFGSDSSEQGEKKVKTKGLKRKSPEKSFVNLDPSVSKKQKPNIKRSPMKRQESPKRKKMTREELERELLEDSSSEDESEESTYEVEKILAKEKRHGVTMYHVKWVGYPLHEATWEPYENLKHCTEILANFEKLKGG